MFSLAQYLSRASHSTSSSVVSPFRASLPNSTAAAKVPQDQGKAPKPIQIPLLSFSFALCIRTCHLLMIVGYERFLELFSDFRASNR